MADSEAIKKWTEVNLETGDFVQVLKGVLFLSILSGFLFLSLAPALQAQHSGSQQSDNINPSYFEVTSTQWGKMAYGAQVPYQPFPLGSVSTAYEHASLNATFPVYILITPHSRSITYDINAVKPVTSIGTSTSYGMSYNYGNMYVGSIYYTSSGVATREITWDPSFSSSVGWGYLNYNTNVLIMERVFGNGPNGAWNGAGEGSITGRALTNNNIAIHWGSILDAVVSFGITA